MSDVHVALMDGWSSMGFDGELVRELWFRGLGARYCT